MSSGTLKQLATRRPPRVLKNSQSFPLCRIQSRQRLDNFQYRWYSPALNFCVYLLMSLQIKRAEVKMSVLLAQHNVPLALADHLSPLIRDVFDGEVAQGYACAKTKTTCILNGAVAPQLRDELVSLMHNTPYSLSVDGSNDSGLGKDEPSHCKSVQLRTHVKLRLDFLICALRPALMLLLQGRYLTRWMVFSAITTYPGITA